MRTSLALIAALGLSLPAQALTQIHSLWDYGRPALSQQRFESTLKNSNCQIQHAYCLELLTQVARAQGLQGKFVEGHVSLDKVKEQGFANSAVVEVRYYLERGRLLNSSRQKTMALFFFEQALKKAEKEKLEYYAIDAAHMLGIAAPLEQQEAWTLQAIDMAEGARDRRARRWLGSLYNNLGWTYHDRKEYNKALSIFQKNINWHQAMGSKTQSKIIAKWAFARTLRSLGRNAEALTRMHGLMRETQAAGLQQDGYIYEEIAENLWVLKRHEEARSYFAQAHALLSKDIWLSQYEPERLARLHKLSMKPEKTKAKPKPKQKAAAKPTAVQKPVAKTAATAPQATKKVETPKKQAQSNLRFIVRVGEFKDRTLAQQLELELKAKGYSTLIIQDGLQYRVQLGIFVQEDKAINLAEELTQKGYVAMVVKARV